MEAVASTSGASELDSTREEKEPRDGGTFTCSFCFLNERFDYKGTKPPFAKHLVYLENCYIMRDPFSPLNQKETLVLGADCNFCGKPVCMDCSLFFAKRFCKTCALENVQDLPLQLHKKIKDLSTEDDNK